MLRVCIASIQNVERSLLLLVVSASDIPLRQVKVKVKEIIVLIKARSFLDELNLEHLTS